MDLDAPEAFGGLDGADALGATLAAPERWERAAEPVEGRRMPEAAGAVVLAGVGPDGATAAALGAAAAAERGDRPVLALPEPALPAFAGRRVPVVVVSSGGDEPEALELADAADRAGAPTWAVTGDGPLAERVGGRGGEVVLAEGGVPALAGALCCLVGLAGDLAAAATAQRGLVAALGPHAPTESNPAKALGAAIAGVALVDVWSTGATAGVAARRLADQLAARAELPAAAADVLTLARAGVNGWSRPVPGAEDRGLVVLRDPVAEPAAAAAALGPTAAVVGEGHAWAAQRAVGAPGEPATARAAALTLLADLVAVYAALARDVDPTPTPAVDWVAAQAAEGGDR